MSNTMIQFKETVSEINRIRNQENMVAENFEKSTCELSECFHWMLESALNGRKHCYLSVHICPELYAKELQGMGCNVKEQINVGGTLCGYIISWE